MSYDETISSPVNLSKRFLPLSTADQIVAWITTFWATILYLRYGLLGLFGGVLIATTVLWSRSWGKTYDRAITHVYDAVTRVIYQNTFWENVKLLKAEGLYAPPSWWRRIFQSLFRRRHPWPLRVDWMEDPVFGEVGVGYNTHSNTDSVVFLGDGSNVSRLEPADRLAKLLALGDAFRRVSVGTSVTVSLVVRPRPPNVATFDDAIDMSHHPDTVLPEARIIELRTGLDAEELYEQGQITREQLRYVRLNKIGIADRRKLHEEHGAENDYAVVLTLPRDPRIGRAARRRRAKPLSDQDARRLPLSRVLKNMETALSNLGVDGLHVLDKQGMEAFCANQRAHLGSEEHDGELPWYHPQVGIYGDKGMTIIDDTLFTAYRVVGMPPKLSPEHISRLFTRNSSVTLAVLGDNTKGSKEGSALYIISTLFDGLTENMRLGKSLIRRRESLEHSADRIADTGHVQYLNTLLVVSGTGPDQFAEDCDSLMRNAGSDGFEIEQVPGSSLQLQAQLAATTGMVRI